MKLLGQGTFGKVVDAWDTYEHRRVAVKIIRAIQKYRDASRIEMRVLQKLKEEDPENKQYVLRSFRCPTSLKLVSSNCIHLLDWFDHRNHVCLVSELLGNCVYDFLKDNQFQPFPRTHIWKFATQLLDSVACECPPGPSPIHAHDPSVLHDLGLVHTDLKPENILLVDDRYQEIQIPTKASPFSCSALGCDVLMLGIGKTWAATHQSTQANSL
jgi:dual-specificity kinase